MHSINGIALDLKVQAIPTVVVWFAIEDAGSELQVSCSTSFRKTRQDQQIDTLHHSYDCFFIASGKQHLLNANHD